MLAAGTGHALSIPAADRSYREMRGLAVVEYISWFNNDRPYESLGDIPPVEFEQLHRHRLAADSLRSPYGLAARIGDPARPTTLILPAKESN